MEETSVTHCGGGDGLPGRAVGYNRGRGGGGGGAVVESYILKRRGYFGDNITQYVKVSSIIQPLQVILEIIYPNTSRYLQSLNLYRLFWR